MVSIGIDLGTYNSAAAYMMPDGNVVILKAYHGPTQQGNVIPSFVKFYANGDFEKYGEPARQELEVAPHLVVWGVKRLLGQSYQRAQESGELDRFHYPTKAAPDGSIRVSICPDKEYTPAEIVTMLLQRIKADCEAPFNPINGPITKLVVTHPAYYDGLQIQDVKDAVIKAGFKEFELLTEPEAAARSYGSIISFSDNSYVLVIDWGAGTLDMVTAKFHLEASKPKITNVSPAYGDNRLGGIDMDDALIEEALRLFDLGQTNAQDQSSLRVEIEKGKIDLSNKSWSKRFFLHHGKA